MLHTKSSQERQVRIETSANESFARFLAKPETKLVISLIPQSENPDALSTLLRCAFDAGMATGQADFLGEMLEAMIKAPHNNE